MQLCLGPRMWSSGSPADACPPSRCRIAGRIEVLRFRAPSGFICKFPIVHILALVQLLICRPLQLLLAQRFKFWDVKNHVFIFDDLHFLHGVYLDVKCYITFRPEN